MDHIDGPLTAPYLLRVAEEWRVSGSNRKRAPKKKKKKKKEEEGRIDIIVFVVDSSFGYKLE